MYITKSRYNLYKEFNIEKNSILGGIIVERRSYNITKGAEKAPQRSLLRACGLTDEEMERPLIGIVSAYSDIVPEIGRASCRERV